MSSIPICSICCDKFTSNSIVQSIKCGHLFHDDCIRRWLNRNTTCPDCRQIASVLNRIYLNFNSTEDKIHKLGTPTKCFSQEMEEEKQRLRIAKDTENVLRNALSVQQKGSVKNTTQSRSKINEPRKESLNVSINVHRERSCSHHKTTNDHLGITLVSVLQCRSRTRRSMFSADDLL